MLWVKHSFCTFTFVYLWILILAIENEYKGPNLEDGKVTVQFMLDLMELYKNQGKLHRKYAYKVSHCLLQIVNIGCWLL